MKSNPEYVHVCIDSEFRSFSFAHVEKKRNYINIPLALQNWLWYNTSCLKDVARLCKGSTTDSGSVCLGSNPSLAAK